MSMTLEEIDLLATKVYDKLRGGMLALPARVTAELRESARYICAPMQVGRNDHYYLMRAQITNEGGLDIQLLDYSGVIVWQAILTTEGERV